MEVLPTVLFALFLLGGIAFVIWLCVAAGNAEEAYKAKLTSPTPITDYVPTYSIGNYISADYNTQRWRPEFVSNAKVWCFSDVIGATILVDGASASYGRKNKARTIAVRITMKRPDMQSIDIFTLTGGYEKDMNSFRFTQSMNMLNRLCP